MEPRTGNLSIAVNLAHQFDTVFVLISEYNRLYLEALEYGLPKLDETGGPSTIQNSLDEFYAKHRAQQGLNACQKKVQRKQNKKLRAENNKPTSQIDYLRNLPGIETFSDGERILMRQSSHVMEQQDSRRCDTFDKLVLESNRRSKILDIMIMQISDEYDTILLSFNENNFERFVNREDSSLKDQRRKRRIAHNG